MFLDNYGWYDGLSPANQVDHFEDVEGNQVTGLVGAPRAEDGPDAINHVIVRVQLRREPGSVRNPGTGNMSPKQIDYYVNAKKQQKIDFMLAGPINGLKCALGCRSKAGATEVFLGVAEAITNANAPIDVPTDAEIDAINSSQPSLLERARDGIKIWKTLEKLQKEMSGGGS